jgi:hypothetical protein
MRIERDQLRSGVSEGSWVLAYRAVRNGTFPGRHEGPEPISSRSNHRSPCSTGKARDRALIVVGYWAAMRGVEAISLR